MKLLLMTVCASVALAQPKLPFEDWKACPGEGCRYGEWTARKSAVVYDTWKEGRQTIGVVGAGEKLMGVAGMVITFRPGVLRIYRDLPELKLKRGDEVFTYAWRGEGFSAVWINGKYDPDYDISFTKFSDGSGCGGTLCAANEIDPGEKVWWAQVKLASGKSGWINMNNAEIDCPY